ncbi:MAG: DUF4255 domain-containing protein [Deltaproteobacteria bacterium]|nr:DUF4255 domain-containing protein [Deltaproteobacteria bacterium]
MSREVIREVSVAWEERLRLLFDKSFRKYVRVVQGPPSRDRIGGKLPLVAIHLFDIHLTEHAHVTKRHQRAAPKKGDLRGLRLDYQFSAWTEEPLDEQLLLDRIRGDIDLDRTLTVKPAGRGGFKLNITPKPSLKFENAISFWSTMGWPPKVSLQYSVRAS